MMAKEIKRSTDKKETATQRISHKSKQGNQRMSVLKRDILIFISVVALVGTVGLGYFLGKSEAAHQNSIDNEALQSYLKTQEHDAAQKKREEIKRLTKQEEAKHLKAQEIKAVEAKTQEPKEQAIKTEELNMEEPIEQVESKEEEPKEQLRQEEPKEEEEKKEAKKLLKAQLEAPKEIKREKKHEVKPQIEINKIPQHQDRLKILEIDTYQEDIDHSIDYPTQLVKPEEIKAIPRTGRPKMVIIIDDVSSASQLKRMHALGLKITPSIFPPYSSSPSNHLLARGLTHYMVHLPMESGKAFDRQTKTLMTTDSKEKIEARVKEIRDLFPSAKYINNHTGSVFTSHANAMEILYRALQKEGFVFVDSRTIGGSKVPHIAKKYAKRYLARDIFIDNQQSVLSIHRQLKQAVAIAKKRGYVIVIGHPYNVTFQALAQAKSILADVETVYMDEL